MGECFFWYWPTRVVPDQRPLNGRCCSCCRLHGLYAGCILYADKIILLAHNSHDQQKMLDISNSEITALDLHFNVVKSVVMRVGPR